MDTLVARTVWSSGLNALSTSIGLPMSSAPILGAVDGTVGKTEAES
jgi:hypothetical protein